MSNPQGRPVDPSVVVGLTTAYWGSQALFAAHRLGVFEALAGEPLDAPAVARRLGLEARPTRLLLRACAALGLLEQEAGRFRTGSTARALLVAGAPAYLGDAIRYAEDLYEAWGRLAETVRSGRPVVDACSYLGQDPERTRHFVLGMHNRAQGVARALVELVDVKGRRLLDVGGGPGTYAAMFASRNPALVATVLDLPDVVAVAAPLLATLDGGERVSLLAGDYRQTPWPREHDAVLISGVFHREKPAACVGLIERARDALLPGGVLLVSDVFTDPDGGPALAALFGLNMALSAPDGGVHAAADVAAWMGAAGLERVEVRPFPPPMPHRLVMGEKPAGGP